MEGERGVYDTEQLLDSKRLCNAVKSATPKHLLRYLIIGMAAHHDYGHVGPEFAHLIECG